MRSEFSYIREQVALNFLKLGTNADNTYNNWMQRARKLMLKCQKYRDWKNRIGAGLELVKNASLLKIESFFFSQCSLGKLWQDVYSCICFTQMLIDTEIIPRKFLYLSYLARSQALGINKFWKIIMIPKPKNFMLKTF